jgi:hypothetical protein
MIGGKPMLERAVPILPGDDLGPFKLVGRGFDLSESR